MASKLHVRSIVSLHGAPRALALLGAIAVAGCHPADSAPARKHELAIEGEITQDTLTRVRDWVSRTPNAVVVVTSAGGDPNAAFEIAKEIRNHKASVRVRGYCLTTCAQYIYLGAPNVVTETNAVVAFHNSVVAGSALARIIGISIEDESKARFDFMAYQELGLPPEGLIDQFAGLTPTCIEWARAPDGGSRLSYRSHGLFWTPEREWVERQTGRELKGWWPQSQAELESTARAIDVIPQRSGAFRYGPTETWKSLSSRLIASPCGTKGGASPPLRATTRQLVSA